LKGQLSPSSREKLMPKSFRKELRLSVSVAITLASFVGVLGAQTQNEQTPVHKEADAAAMSTAEPSVPPGGQPSSPDEIHLRTGQQIGFVVKTRLSSEHAKVGDVVELEVARPLMVDGLVIIAAGTQAQGEVVVARPRRRKSAAGTLAIAFRDIRTVNGDIVQLAGKEERSGADKKDEIGANIGGAIVQTLGAGAVFAPLFLLQRGESVQLDPGTRLSAFVSRDLALERALIEMHQPARSSELATVYVFHGWHPTCGSMELPFDELQKGVVRLELPPGSYWFHTGAYMGAMRGIFAGTVTGLTFGAAAPSEVSPIRKVLGRPTSEFTALDAKGGQTYYLTRKDNNHSAVKQEFKLMDAAEGEKLLAESDAPYYIVRDISPDKLDQLKAQPLGKNSKP
jgi:hypothetical protein